MGQNYLKHEKPNISGYAPKGQIPRDAKTKQKETEVHGVQIKQKRTA